LHPITKSKNQSHLIDQLKDYLGEEINHIYCLPDKIIPYCYYVDFLWIHLFSLEVENLKKMKIKELIIQQKARINECLHQKNYSTLFSLTEKIIKIDMFIKYFDKIPDQDKYSIYRKVYRQSEYNFHFLKEEFLDKVFSYRHLSPTWKESMKLLKERTEPNGELTIYRGEGSKSDKKGLSWTLDATTAHFFATRFDDSGVLWKAKVHIDDVLDFIDNGESEVLVKHKHLFKIEKSQVTK